MMSPNDYQSMAMRTKADPAKILARLNELGPAYLQAMIASNGGTNEQGEISDILKATIEYGKGPIDPVHLTEEIGDALWRLAQLADAFGIKFEDCMRANIEKLKKRYPDTFSDYHALNRDLSAERESLEKSLNTFMFQERNRRGNAFTVKAHSIEEARQKVLAEYPPGDGVLPSEYPDYYKLVAHDYVQGTDHPKAAPLRVVLTPVNGAGFAEPPEETKSDLES